MMIACYSKRSEKRSWGRQGSPNKQKIITSSWQLLLSQSVEICYSPICVLFICFLLSTQTTTVTSFAVSGSGLNHLLLFPSSSASSSSTTRTRSTEQHRRGRKGRYVALYQSLFGQQESDPNRNDVGNSNKGLGINSYPEVVSTNNYNNTTTTAATTSIGSSSRPIVDWEVYVDQSKASLDKGGSATLDAFVGLAPSTSVQVRPAIIPLKSKSKGPLVRCIYTGQKEQGKQQRSFEVTNVDSVDKVYRILTKHMQVKGVSATTCDCLNWKYKGNEHLESGNIDLAVNAYNQALATGCVEEEGVVLLMRATAYLRRAALHKQKLKEVVNDLIGMVPPTGTVKKLYQEVSLQQNSLSLSNSLFRRVLDDARNQERQFRRTQFWHGLYQYALLHAAQDSLRATQLLPKSATAWVRAGNILSELWKLKESAQYYEYAIGLEDSLVDSLLPVIDRLRQRQELLDSARAYGWSEDTLRLALDVAG